MLAQSEQEKGRLISLSSPQQWQTPPPPLCPPCSLTRELQREHSIAPLSLSLYISLSQPFPLSLYLLGTAFNDQATPTNEQRQVLAKPTQTIAKWWTSTQWRPKHGSGGACTAHDAPQWKWRSNTGQRPLLTANLGAGQSLSVSSS